MYIPITDPEMRAIRLLAKGRCEPKERRHVPGHTFNKGALEAHIEGMKAEYAVAKALNILPDIALYLHGDDKCDLRLTDGRTLQVKYRDRRGWDYALTTDDPAEFVADIGVLCWPIKDGVDIVGCISRDKFLKVAQVVDYGHGKRLAASPKHFTPIEVIFGRPE